MQSKHSIVKPHQNPKTLKAKSAKNLRAGFSTALSELYQRCYLKLVASIKSTYGNGPPEPEDLVQQAFIKLHQRGSLDDIKDLEGYVWIAARNSLISFKRAQRTQSKNEDEIKHRFWPSQCDNLDPERVFISERDTKLVLDAIEQMPERRREIFLLHRVEGMTPAQAGAKCGVSRSSAVRHIAIATATISEALLNESKK